MVLLGERIEDREHHLLYPTERLKEKAVLINFQLQVLSDEMAALKSCNTSSKYLFPLKIERKLSFFRNEIKGA